MGSQGAARISACRSDVERNEMRPKLKPMKLDRYFIRPKRSVDYKKLYERAREFLSERKASRLAFDLMGIDDASEVFRRDIGRFFRALHVAKRDSTDLSDEVASLQGHIIDFRGHMRQASKTLSELADIARNRPPLDKATDLQLTKRTLAQQDRFFERVNEQQQRLAKKTGNGKKNTRTKKKTRASSRRKTKSCRSG